MVSHLHKRQSPGTRRPLSVAFLRHTICLLTLATVNVFGASEFAPNPSPEPSAITFREDFRDLDGWRAWEFDKVDRPTLYEIHEKEKQTVLRMEADRSASGLILEQNFPTKEGVRVRWRWRADILPDVSDPLQREGDDFAIRIYVIFEQDASDAGWLERWALRKAPFRDEGILPERSLAYAWSDMPNLPEHYPNPYTDRVVVLPVLTKEEELGEWQEVEVTPFADYRNVFGEKPPRHFRLAIMSDSDDSLSRSKAWLDFIEVRLE